MKTEKMRELLKVLMKNSKLSDREIAKRLDCSQPTVTRLRRFLEKQGWIRSYTIVPEFGKVGYKILAFTFSSLKTYPNREKAVEIIQKAVEWLRTRPNVIYATDGQGLGGKDIVMISFHKDYDDYTRFMHEYALDWGEIVSSFESFMTNLNSDFIMRKFDLAHLADDL